MRLLQASILCALFPWMLGMQCTSQYYVPPTVAAYPAFDFSSGDHGDEFDDLEIRAAVVPEGVFEVEFPNGERIPLEDLDYDFLATNKCFDEDEMRFLGDNMRVDKRQRHVTVFRFGNKYFSSHPGKPGAVKLIHKSSNAEIRFPIKRMDMERLFGKDYEWK